MMLHRRQIVTLAFLSAETWCVHSREEPPRQGADDFPLQGNITEDIVSSGHAFEFALSPFEENPFAGDGEDDDRGSSGPLLQGNTTEEVVSTERSFDSEHSPFSAEADTGVEFQLLRGRRHRGSWRQSVGNTIMCFASVGGVLALVLFLLYVAVTSVAQRVQRIGLRSNVEEEQAAEYVVDFDCSLASTRGGINRALAAASDCANADGRISPAEGRFSPADARRQAGPQWDEDEADGVGFYSALPMAGSP